jgi:hypothetical protein
MITGMAVRHATPVGPDVHALFTHWARAPRTSQADVFVVFARTPQVFSVIAMIAPWFNLAQGSNVSRFQQQDRRGSRGLHEAARMMKPRERIPHRTAKSAAETPRHGQGAKTKKARVSPGLS